MKRVVFEVGAPVAAALVALAVTTGAGMASGPWRVLIIAAAALVALAAAAAASGPSSPTRRAIKIGNRQSAQGNVNVEDISADPTGADVEIGGNNKSGKDITIKGVNVQRKPPGSP